MMGRLKSEQGQLFYQFQLGDAVPEDHLVRAIDAALDLSWLRSELAPHYSSMGRPSIDPELVIRMLVVGYVFAIRSERLICREVQVNLAYRWFCKLGIEDAIPDHSTFSRARNERFREVSSMSAIRSGNLLPSRRPFRAASTGAALIEQNRVETFRVEQPPVVGLAAAAGAAMRIDRGDAIGPADGFDVNLVALADGQQSRR
jgi:transposase-like protein DUF772